jgi:hypothetical protein
VVVARRRTCGRKIYRRRLVRARRRRRRVLRPPLTRGSFFHNCMASGLTTSLSTTFSVVGLPSLSTAYQYSLTAMSLSTALSLKTFGMSSYFAFSLNFLYSPDIYLIQESIPCGRRKLVITCGRWSRRWKLNRLRSLCRHRNNYRKRKEGKQYVENARHLLLTHTLLRSTYSIPLVRQHKWRPFPLIP